MKIINNKHTLLYNLPIIHSIQRYNFFKMNLLITMPYEDLGKYYFFQIYIKSNQKTNSWCWLTKQLSNILVVIKSLALNVLIIKQ